MKVTLKIRSQLAARLSAQVRSAAAVAIQKTAVAAVDILSKIADAKLGHSADDFKNALPDAISAEKTSLKIELTGFAKDLNDGFAARDMKPDLLASPGAKTSATGGRYIDIPFKHTLKTLPGSIRTSVERQVSKELSSAKSEGRPTQSPLRVVGSLPGQVNSQQRFNSKGTTRQVDVKQKTSIYSDMFRVAKNKASGSYQTIRRISDNSDKQSWWHPGFEGIRALEQAKSELHKRLETFFREELKKSKGMKPK